MAQPMKDLMEAIEEDQTLVVEIQAPTVAQRVEGAKEVNFFGWRLLRNGIPPPH